MEKLETGDILVGGRHRFRHQDQNLQSPRDRYFGEGSPWEPLDNEQA